MLVWLALGAIHHVIAALNPVDTLARGVYFIGTDMTLPGQEYVVAINIVPSTGDIFIHMSADAAINSSQPAFSWMGVGFGSRMQDTFMFIAYPSKNGTGLTISPRRARGHSEPEHMPDVVIKKIFDDAYAPHANTVGYGVMIAHAVCRNCTALILDKVDLDSKAQPFIYALGAAPKISDPLQSDYPSAGLRMHAFRGHFLADMTFATSPETHARVPHPNDPGGSPSGVADTNFASAFSTTPYGASNDTEWAPVLHGVLMSLAFVLIFPLGAVLMRLLKRFGFVVHISLQILGSTVVVIGVAAGVYVSKRYNQTRGFGASHQVLGLVVFAALIVQVMLGSAHHRLYVRLRKETTIGVAHRCLGPAVIVLGLVNGGLGLDLAGKIAGPGEIAGSAG